MRTIILKTSPKKPDAKKIRMAATIIRRGGIVAFPTETVYGVGANALDEKAVRKIFRAKGRPFDDPLIVHISAEWQLGGLVKKVSALAKSLMKEFWPGPLTLVLKNQGKCLPLSLAACTLLPYGCLKIR